MSKPSSEAESSCKRQENGDVAAGSDRPLKKARFAWQVKGKYHLRNDTSETDKPSTANRDPDNAGTSSDSENDSNDLVGNTEQNLEILGDYLLKQDFNTLDSVITDSDKSLLKPCPNISPGKLSYPRYVSTYETGGASHNSSDYSSRDNVSIPMSMVHQSPSFSEDQCIARWQARQMAKGFVDNTINRVLDSWMVTPMPTENDSNRFLALDVAEFINNLPGDNSIENEGILMAISAHGLQNTSNASTSTKEDNKNHQYKSKSSKNNVFPSPPSSPVLSDDESMNETMKEDQSDKVNSHVLTDSCSCPGNDTSGSNSNLFQPNPFAPFSLFPDPEGSSDNEDMNENTSTNDDIFANHFDFMDAAVTFAIQNKGLTSFGTDYG
ncbi:hypothetical protein JYU34_015736 [Plutella xylostella]|uniref:Uncharacterized protein n=1 Tax=Plutella xylostella TaxID=51655 RepID=A0ABQ7Q4L0_PLUXY|nr:hypothetical protein JYU34_015736 [Plutella xylostella]